MSVLQKIFGSAGLRSRDDVGSTGLRPRENALQAAALTPEEELIVALDVLSGLRNQAEDIAHPFVEQMKELERAKAEALGNLTDRMAIAEQRVKALSLRVGKNVFGNELKAEFVSAAQTVDVKGLLGYAVDHPEVQTFIQDGKPSCRIKPISANERKALSMAALN